jgi:hypothetical protein
MTASNASNDDATASRPTAGDDRTAIDGHQLVAVGARRRRDHVENTDGLVDDASANRARFPLARHHDDDVDVHAACVGDVVATWAASCRRRASTTRSGPGVRDVVRLRAVGFVGRSTFLVETS